MISTVFGDVLHSDICVLFFPTAVSFLSVCLSVRSSCSLFLFFSSVFLSTILFFSCFLFFFSDCFSFTPFSFQTFLPFSFLVLAVVGI